MRLLTAAILAIFLAVPAWAQTTDTSGTASQNYGRFVCSQHFDCPDAGSLATKMSSYLGTANSCVTQFTGYANAKGFFDPSIGFDANSCLTAYPDAIPRGVGSQMVPTCCIMQVADKCTFKCEINAAQ